MNRRTFIGMIAGGLLAAPLAAEAHRVARVPLFGAIEDPQTRSDREMLR
jgi:hypothetical protein